MIMDDLSTKNAGGVTFTEPHGTTFADVDGDGIPDFIVGKRYWSHRDDYLDPDPYGPAVLYWYRTVRNPKAPGGAEFVPELIHNRSGAGSDIYAADLNHDGAHRYRHRHPFGTFIFWGKPGAFKTEGQIISMKPSAHNTALLIFWVAIACSCAVAQQDHKSWSDYGGGPDTSRFTALDQIKKSNVKQLQVAWTYFNGNSAMNPIVSHGVMYVYGRNNSLIALDAATGKEIWIHTGLSSIAELGVNYWESKDGKDRRLIFQINHFLEEIDARTGKSILSFGEDGLVDMREGLDRVPAEVARIKSDAPGRVFENLIIEGSSTGENFLAPPGHIRAYDVLTGKMVWTFHTVPYPGEFGYDTWPKDAWRYIGGVNDWGELSLDEKRGIVYVVLGSPTYDLYGADRIGAGLFGDSLVALDARTGKRLWHFQEVHHDLWDSDPCSAPQLITVRHNGKMVDAVAQAGKTGFLYVFDRVTGEPLWPIEERPVPQSDVPGEQAWPTQPFPTAPPPFARQKMTADDINPFFLTPEERATWKEKIASRAQRGAVHARRIQARYRSAARLAGRKQQGHKRFGPNQRARLRHHI